jgi:ribosome-binding ATPase YchF (GTP1/OBG family)
MITLALAGKPNCGKSTFFRAATLADAEIANYPFTTIDANHGVGYVRSPCPCTTLALPGGTATCGHCTDGVRFIPVNLIDVAGLVPEAHTGRGLGNQFLDHLRQADAIIHVVDGSGATDAEGNPVGIGEHDPESDIAFLPLEMTMWVYGILAKHWAKLLRQAQAKTFVLHAAVAEVLAGLAITPEDVAAAVRETGVDLISVGALTHSVKSLDISLDIKEIKRR